MAVYDQLGLFGNSGADHHEGSSNSVGKLELAVEFSEGASARKIDEVMKRFKKELESIDPMGRLTKNSHHAYDETSWRNLPFLALDVETTGLDAAANRVIELALVPYNFGEDTKTFCQLFSPGMLLTPEIVNITGITDVMLQNEPVFAERADAVLKIMRKASFVVAYNAKFDRPFLESEMARIKKVLPTLPWIDPYIFICELDRFRRGKKLGDAAKRWGVNLENAHRALADAQAAGELILKLADKIDCHSLDDLIARQKIFEWQNAHHMAELKRSSSWSMNR